MNLALVAMPWPLFNRPAIQLGVLKGYLREKAPELRVKTFYPYVSLAARLGYPLYQALSETQWLSEAFGAALMFPKKKESISTLVKREALKRGLNISFEETLDQVREELEKFLQAVPWADFQLVGFSVCLNQLHTSLWAASWLKRHFQVPVVFGGSGCAAEMGRALLEVFPFVDYVINGEGEGPLWALIRYLQGQGPLPQSGLFHRKGEEICGGGLYQIPAEEIPLPIYDDYLRTVAALPPKKRFFPVIPLEASRGCWWLKCRFCNLNLQWQGYRPKPLARVLKEVRAHARAGLLDFAFMDNCLPIKGALRLFEALAEDQVDYRFFAELRAVYRRKDFALLRRGGLKWVQIGIEALSASLLKRLNKGTTLIDNVAALRHCEEQGLELEANLILHFPGSTREEVAETLRVLEFCFPFRPLRTVSFWLGYGSHVFRYPAEFGIKTLYPHPYYRSLWPKDIYAKLKPLIWEYRADRTRQRRLWAPVEKKVRQWQENYSRLRSQRGPLLSFRDGGNFLLLRQVLPSGEVLHHRLTGISREIYLFLTDHRSMKEIHERFPNLSQEKLREFLKDLELKRLVFEHNGHYLALAIHKP